MILKLPFMKASWHQLALWSCISVSIRWKKSCSDNAVCLERYETAYLQIQWVNWRLASKSSESPHPCHCWHHSLACQQGRLSLLCTQVGYHILLACTWCRSSGPHTCLPALHSPGRFVHVWFTACLSGRILSFNENFKILRTALLNSFPSWATFNSRVQSCLTGLLHPSTVWCPLPQPTFHSLHDLSFQSTHFLDAPTLVFHSAGT